MLDRKLSQDIKDLIEELAPRSFEPIDWRRYEDTAPEALVEIWRSVGAASWDDGSFQTIDPLDFMSITDTALLSSSIREDRAIPYLVSAFGRITAWHPDVGVITVDALFGRNLVSKSPLKRKEGFSAGIEILSGFPIKRSNELDLFRAATKRLGLLAKNEIFAFTPALCFGGRAELKNISKELGDVHLDILSQSVEFQTFYVEGSFSDARLVPM